MRPTFIASLLTIASIVPRAVATTVPFQEITECPDKIKALCDAVKLPDEAERNEVLMRLFPNALQSPEPETRQAAFGLLSEVSRQMNFDPRSLHEALAAFDRLQDGNRGAGLIDRFELIHCLRESRLRVYMTAIVEGEARYGSVSTIARSTAMESAAKEGMGELRSLIERYYTETSNEVKRAMPLDYLLVTLELRDGANDERGAVLKAVQRLDAMPTQDLWARIERGEAGAGPWERAYLATRREACGDATSAACRGIRQVDARLSTIVTVLLKAEHNKRIETWNRGEARPEPGPRENRLQAWLSTLARTE